MGAGLGRMPSAIGWLFLCAAISTCCFSVAAAVPPTDEQVRGWIRDLDADSFAVRESAADQLAIAGPRATPLLSACASSGSAEASWRASAVLAAIQRETPPLTTVEAAMPRVDSSLCTDDPLAADPSKPPSGPEPPPEADIVQALAPPPAPLPLETITEQVLIADAFVSPQLAGEHRAAEPSPMAEPPLVPAIQPARQWSRSIADTPAARGNSSVTFVRYPAVRTTANASRETQPRWINILHRTRTFFGLSVR